MAWLQTFVFGLANVLVGILNETPVIRGSYRAEVPHAGAIRSACGFPLLELAASLSIGNGASPLSDGRPPLLGGAPEGRRRG
jgi:hypothetical protein